MKTFTITDSKSGESGQLTTRTAHEPVALAVGDNVKMLFTLKPCDICEQDRIRALIRGANTTLDLAT